MAKKDFTYTFKNATIDLETNTIIEIGKDFNTEYVLSEVLNELKDKTLNITFKETYEVFPDSEEE